jgi:hypothetical protein
LWKLTHSAWLHGALRINFQILAYLKIFEKFPTYSDFFLKSSRPYMYTRSALDGALWVSLKFQKKMNFGPAQLTCSALLGVLLARS